MDRLHFSLNYLLWDENQKYYFEQNAETSFAFFRFYNKALSFKSDLEDISQYQELFEDKLEREEIFELLTPLYNLINDIFVLELSVLRN